MDKINEIKNDDSLNNQMEKIPIDSNTLQKLTKNLYQFSAFMLISLIFGIVLIFLTLIKSTSLKIFINSEFLQIDFILFVLIFFIYYFIKKSQNHFSLFLKTSSVNNLNFGIENLQYFFSFFFVYWSIGIFLFIYVIVIKPLIQK